MAKPSNLLYGVNDKPPFFTSLILGVQHIFIVFISVIFPVIIIRNMGEAISAHNARAFISLSLLSGGIITILQSLRSKKFGSGYLCPSVSGPSYLNASILAASAGGLPLLFGMTAFVGFIEALFSRVMHKLKALFPPEVTGTVVALVGIVVIPISIKDFEGIGPGDNITQHEELWVGFITLVTMIILNVYSKGKLRLYCVIIGMIVGYVSSFLFGLLDTESIAQVKEAPLFSLPYIEKMRWAIDFHLMIPFTIAALASTFKTVGDISTCQRINDTKWKRTNMKTVSGGILVDGIGGILPGVVGGFGQSTSSSNVGLSVATGATSRIIAWFVGGLLIFLAFFPKLANVFIIMPKPVMGAVLIFSVSFMIIQGFQMVMSRMLDSRKIFVVGISLIFGLSVDMVPGLYDNVHPYLKPVFSSSLSLGSVSVVLLNLLLRIGISKHACLVIKPFDPGSDNVFAFFEQQGQKWGARREVITKLSFAVCEASGLIFNKTDFNEDIEVKAKFNEYALEVEMLYKGRKINLPETSPDPGKVETDPEWETKLAGFLIPKFCDKIKVSGRGETSKVWMKFEH
ncbi:MAG: purine/pyrimidine permease [Prolixibacteraceae bacterium]|nr:purine/pyrimidine permease [Prolixibacteraceae bacterium]